MHGSREHISYTARSVSDEARRHHVEEDLPISAPNEAGSPAVDSTPVQEYGTVASPAEGKGFPNTIEDDVDPDGTLAVSASEPEDTDSPSTLKRYMRKVIPQGGFRSGVFNFAGSSLGAGILALPYAFNAAGIVMGTFYLLIFFLFTVFSCNLLGLVAQKTGFNTYERMAQGLFGTGGDIFAAVVMFFKCFGACVAYVICVYDLFTAFLSNEGVPARFQTPFFRRLLTSVAFVVLMLPLSLPKRINSLRYVSLAGVLCIIYFVVCIIIHSVGHGIAWYGDDDGDDAKLVYFATDSGAVRAIGMFSFSFLCQSNVPEILSEQRPRPSVDRLVRECFVSMLLCSILYWLAGFFAYCDFGAKVESSLLTMYDPVSDHYFAVAYVGLVVKLCVAFALHILPCRDAVHHLLGWHLDTVPWGKNAILCATLSLVSLVFGLVFPNVNTVFGLLGSLTGGFIAFVFPALFFMYAGAFNRESVGDFFFFGSYVLLVAGVFVIVFGTTSTIYGML